MTFLLSAWGWLAGSRLGRLCAAVAGVIAALGFAYLRGRSAAREAQERRNLEEYRDVRKRADEAAREADGDVRPVDERLRSRGALRDD